MRGSDLWKWPILKAIFVCSFFSRFFPTRVRLWGCSCFSQFSNFFFFFCKLGVLRFECCPLYIYIYNVQLVRGVMVVRYGGRWHYCADFVVTGRRKVKVEAWGGGGGCCSSSQTEIKNCSWEKYALLRHDIGVGPDIMVRHRTVMWKVTEFKILILHSDWRCVKYG